MQPCQFTRPAYIFHMVSPFIGLVFWMSVNAVSANAATVKLTNLTKPLAGIEPGHTARFR